MNHPLPLFNTIPTQNVYYLNGKTHCPEMKIIRTLKDYQAVLSRV